MNPRIFRLVLLAGILALSAIAHAGPAGWPQDVSDLKPDPRVTFGHLDNGLRYLILPNANPKGRVSLRFWVGAGSLHERDDERGLAHFVEHMAFRGTTHFAADQLIEYCERHGMSLSDDTNAYTSFDHTVYLLDLASSSTKERTQGLSILRDWADGVLFDPGAVEKERGVVESERRAGNNAGQRFFDQKLDRILGGTIFAHHSLIGETPVILHSSPDTLRGFYDAWYRPERMVIIVAGDIDPASVQKEIGTIFSDLKSRSAARPEPEIGHLSDRGLIGSVFSDKEFPPGSSVFFDSVRLSAPPLDTAAQRKRNLLRGLGIAIFNRRLNAIAAEAGYNFSAPGIQWHDEFQVHGLSHVSLSATGPIWKWKDNIGILEHELRRVLQYGFTAGELRQAAAAASTGQEHSARTQASWTSPEWCSYLLGHLERNTVIVDQADVLEALRRNLSEITPEMCTGAFRELFSTQNQFVSAMGSTLGESDGKAVLAAYEEKQKEGITPPRDVPVRDFHYTDFGPAGTVQEETEVKDLGFKAVKFANGVSLNVKRTPFRKDSVLVAIRFGGGRLQQPSSRPGLVDFTPIWPRAGLLKNSQPELRDLKSLHVQSTNFGVSLDHFDLTAYVATDDLRFWLQLQAAFFTEPAFEKGPWKQAWAVELEHWFQRRHSPSGIVNRSVVPLLADNDPRMHEPGLLARLLFRRSTFINWFRPILNTTPIEISVVGDADPEAVITEVAKTFGTFPSRTPTEETGHFPIHGRTDPVDRTFHYSNAAGKALVYLAWRAGKGDDYAEIQKAELLAEIFSDRLRKEIRGEMGSTYSPEVGVNAPDASPDYNYLICQVDVTAPRVPEVENAIKRTALSIAQLGITDEEFERAHAPAVAGFTTARTTNDYWLYVLSGSQSKPRWLGWNREAEARLQAVTKGDLEKTARDYFQPTQLSTFRILPR